MRMTRGRHKVTGQEMFLILFIEDLQYVIQMELGESIWKYQRDRECQEHIVLRLVGGNHNN